LNESNDSNPQLEALIYDKVRERNGITFRDFMDLSLYHPEWGYYMAPRDRIGKEGDFFTSTSVHALFGRLVARQLRQMWELLGKKSFTIVEQGPGEGHFALDILNAAASDAPEFYDNLRYVLVEISPDNRERQRRTLAPHAERVSWSAFDDIDAIEGCFLSNELVDSFPVHLVEKKEGELREVFVVERDGTLSEELRPLSTSAIEEHFSSLGVTPVEGNRAEVNLDAVRWMEGVAQRLKRGFALTIDYGYPAAELYAPFRRNGTLLCYHRHTSSDNPYQRIGFQDITSHVDFTALEKAGDAAGLAPLYFGEQYRFLMGLGFVEALIEMQANETDENRARALRMTLKNLILPDEGMGETFKVLVQGKGVGHPELLCARPIGSIPLPTGGLF